MFIALRAMNMRCSGCYICDVSLDSYLRAMPKVELHVHLVGAIRPETLLKLADANKVSLPHNTLEGLRTWYTFTNFLHFSEIYATITGCIKTASDLELVTREFLQGQAEQNIVHTEVTHTVRTLFRTSGMGIDAQMEAINRARSWARQHLGVSMSLILDIVRERPTEDGIITAEWAANYAGQGVDAIGLGGYEVGHPPEKHIAGTDIARAAGLPSLPHAGETEGAASIWGALNSLHAMRIGHGVRCLEDPALVQVLRDRQIPLEVCPSSNVCLGVVPSLAKHPLPQLLALGLCVTINSDDPPMFNTTLSDEYVRCSETFGFDAAQMDMFSLTALHCSLLPPAQKEYLERRFRREFAQLRAIHLT